MNNKRVKQIDGLFAKGLNDNVFSGGAFAFSLREKTNYKRTLKWYGNAEITPEIKKLTKLYFFDLASLTKPLTTVPLLLTLFNKGILSEITQLKDIFSNCPSDKKEIQIRELMSHCAGFPAHKEYYKEIVTRKKIERKTFLLNLILQEKLISKPSEYFCYSDIGFMLLGLIIETVTGKTINELSQSFVYGPLGLENMLFFPCSLKKDTELFVSTEKCLWSGKMLSGEVHDDNCRVVGGQTGHAGLFGTITGVISLCEQLLDQWQGRSEHPFYTCEQLNHVLQRVGESTWTMGFNMVSKEGSSSGRYFSDKSVGHLGFTGTSFWIDPVKDCVAVLLTNRVHPSRDNLNIREFRPAFHDLLMQE